MLIVVSCNKLRTISASFELRLECETVSSCDSHLSSGPCLLASRETRNEQVEIGDSHEINVEGNHDDLFNILISSFPEKIGTGGLAELILLTFFFNLRFGMIIEFNKGSGRSRDRRIQSTGEYYP